MRKNLAKTLEAKKKDSDLISRRGSVVGKKVVTLKDPKLALKKR